MIDKMSPRQMAQVQRPIIPAETPAPNNGGHSLRDLADFMNNNTTTAVMAEGIAPRETAQVLRLRGTINDLLDQRDELLEKLKKAIAELRRVHDYDAFIPMGSYCKGCALILELEAAIKEVEAGQ